MKRLLLPVMAWLVSYASFANVKAPHFFGDNMVLQRAMPIPVWGWADAGEKITVQFNQQTKTVKAGKDGQWRVNLDAELAGGPYTLTLKGKNSISYTNVLVGDVWICSGQSNMEMPIAGWGKINHYQDEINAANFPLIRQIKVPNAVSFTPKNDIDSATWLVCSPATAGDFTATGYFFARELYKKLQIPIGLINTSWGGTMVETWASKGAFEQSDEFKTMIAGMSAPDLQSLAKQKSEQVIRDIEKLQGPIEKNPQTDSWSLADYDDSHWGHMALPGLWEERGLDNLDGVVWFRKTVIIPESAAGKAATIDLGKIDDSDDSYVNGTKIGFHKNQYSEPRHYVIPAGVLKAGKNTIAIRVEDTGGGGGVFGEASELGLAIGNVNLPLAGDWSFKVEKISPASLSVGPNSYPTLLYNAMINPLIPYAIKGAIWYQGEANAGRAFQYRKSFPLMITDWRQQWKQGDFPFYFVQLASWNADNGNSTKGSTWAELREAQTRTLALPNTGMAVTTDIGEAGDIHPKNKQDVGKRLAAIALHNLYAQPTEYSGPVYESMKTDGNKVILTFTHVGEGLLVKDKYGYLKGFEVAGDDQIFHYARAYLEGDKVIVSADAVARPVAVHYAWADDAGEANLFNKDGFPANSFRTDAWKGITETAKYQIGH